MEPRAKPQRPASNVVIFPNRRYSHRSHDQARDRVLAELMLKRLDFERRIQRGEMTNVEIVTEETNLTTELLLIAEQHGL